MHKMKVPSRLRWSLGLLGLVLLVSGAAPGFAATPAEKCAGAKAKAFGAAAKVKAKCHAKARKSGTAVDAGCLQKADAKLQARFTKADAAGACPGDAAGALGATTECATTFAGATAGDAACAAGKIKAAGKLAAGRTACAKKALVKGPGVEAACLAQVAQKFAKAVGKADGKGLCTGTVASLEAAVDACLVGLSFPIACTGGTGHPTCDGACADELTCRPYEVFVNGASATTGCSCVDVAGPACGGTTCGVDQHCTDPTEVCERWLGGDPLGCDHMICQPAMTTPTTIPPREMLECDGGEFPTCGGTCPTGERCQAVQARLSEFTLFAGCVCVDPRGPRCEMPTDCDLEVLPFSHCADPSKVCLVTLEGEGEAPSCTEAHCGEPQPIVPPPTSTTTTSTSTSTTASTSTSTSTTIPCVSTPGVSGTLQDLGDCTILDTATGLQWEKKTDTIPNGLHDVDNRYSWAGCCDWDCSLENHCQPNAAAVDTCLALADNGTEGCSLCTTGTCRVDVFGIGAKTTVWDWLNQVNDYGLAGHSDWRLAKEWGFNSGPKELESILLMPEPCTTGPLPCIDPIFGPTLPEPYWSATTKGPTGPTRPSDAWFVDFLHGNFGDSGKWGPFPVRAVRTPE
jgi:hypothetical protein